MNESELQRVVEIRRQCLRAAVRSNDPWAARSYQRRLAEALTALRQARVVAEAEYAAFENDINPS
jgi:hypothetical protein